LKSPKGACNRRSQALQICEPKYPVINNNNLYKVAHG
jgi:hypothetical protein